MADVTLKLTVGAVSVEVTGPEEYAERKFQELVAQYLTTAKPIGETRTVPSVSLEPGGKRLSVNEFLKKVGAKNHPDRALALAYYMEQVEGVKSFTTTELGDKGRDAKNPFGNVSDVVARLTSRGLMMSAGEKDGQRAYALTASGEELVASMLESTSS